MTYILRTHGRTRRDNSRPSCHWLLANQRPFSCLCPLFHPLPLRVLRGPP